MKKLLSCLLACLVLVGCGTNQKEEVEENQMVGIANPFVNYESLEEAIEGATVSMNVPEAVGTYMISEYRAMPGKMLEIIYKDAEENMIHVRKEAGDEDISGYYGSEVFIDKTLNHYDINYQISTDEAGLIHVATWLTETDTYGMTADLGISEEDFISLINTIMHTVE